MCRHSKKNVGFIAETTLYALMYLNYYVFIAEGCDLGDTSSLDNNFIKTHSDIGKKGLLITHSDIKQKTKNYYFG